MTVQNQSSRVDYVSTGEGKVFPVPFRFLAPEHLHVYVGEEETELAYGPGFYMENRDVVLMAGVGAGVPVSIRRVTPILQPIDLRTQGPYSPDTLEEMADRAILVAQELRDGNIDASTIITGDVVGAENVGNVGIGVFSALAGKILQFRKLAAANNKITVTHESTFNTIRVGLGTVGPADVGAAPAAHVGSRDGHPLATAEADGMMPKEAVAKLASVDEGANAYVHPATHPAEMIVQTTSRQFVSFDQKTAWTAAAAHAGTTGNPHGLTREDIGAASAEAFTAHAAARNPHGLTAADIDAATTGALAVVAGNLATHAAGQNPHGTTANDVGAPTLTAHNALAARVTALEGKPLGGTFVYDFSNGGWNSPNARGVNGTADEPDAGVAKIEFLQPFANANHYLATVTCHINSSKKTAAPHLKKYADRLEITFLDIENQPMPGNDFELVIQPL